MVAGLANLTMLVVWREYSSSSSYTWAKKGTLLQTTAIECTLSVTSSTHLHPNRPVRVSPALSASCISPYLTAATPSVVSMRNGKVDSDHAVLPPSAIEWYAVDTPSVTAYMDFERPTNLVWCVVVSNTRLALPHTLPTVST